ncbi:hypothetical protein SAMD00079811_69760 [Scytonema sp. HK-05]|uniref:P-loop NTPase fold protein n=1 Tax=Scytonema sp. HK-05 TaxID=1137095 RepID=UPI000935BA79|nr:P-loop NTPase fold protein [Scytonema sp. HK-05]OKH56194.1 NTPase [Scytonema sp. HK-05]BAY49347.1 hypothetical protein SAMD00079811_69760 [Scytonema sp. HK-05]
MTQGNKSINSHIETYLDYYCGLSHAPGFAVLLKGQWGAGKTWFINKYCEKLKTNNQKCLYVSLYGMTTFSEIEDVFFQQLHPVLSSKGMAITGKIFKGLLKGTLKIDLNDDSRDDGTWSVQIPEINLPEYLRNTEKSILVFDDLERCKIDIGNILGYINYFVEHQELKVVIVANEDKLLENCSYKDIKEKIIGKTFDVFPDFEGALENFILSANDSEVRVFLSDNTHLIQDLYTKTEYENLRTLKQIVLDFERIFETLPKKAKNKSEILEDLLTLLMAFSIEIKRGTMLPKDISRLQEEYVSGISNRVSSHQLSNSVAKDNSEKQTSVQKILSRYTVLNLHDPFPSTVWWQIFFDKGIVDTQELEQSILNSKYFQDENTPNWVRMWHFSDLSDDDFENLLKKVESEYRSRQFVEIGEIKHIFGLFLMFSHAGLYWKSKEEILKESKLYIDYLKDNNPLVLISPSTIEDVYGSYGSLGFQGKEFEEFKEFFTYIDEVRELARNESMPSAGQELLVTMQSDAWKFYRMICLTSSPDGDVSVQKYHEVPILKYIESPAFIEKLLLMKSKDQRFVFGALKKRYEFDSINGKLIEELDWLKSVQSLLLEEASSRKGKVSGFVLESLTKHYLNGVIEKLEKNRSQV